MLYISRETKQLEHTDNFSCVQIKTDALMIFTR